MAAKLKGALKRLVRVGDLQVIAVFTESQVEMSLPGFKTKCFCTWADVAKMSRTPQSVPSYCMGDGMALLRYQEAKLDRKGKKKEVGMVKATSC